MQVKRPLWRNYLFAYLIIGMGVVLVDVSAGPNRNIVGMIVGVTSFLVGLLIFVTAVVTSVRFVLAGKPKQIDACSSCTYDLSGNTSGVCPQCGTANESISFY